MIIFTSICANYLHKARTLAKSVKQNMPDVKFIVCMVEREIRNDYYNENFDRIVLAKDAWIDDFDSFIFKHDIVEASTAVKGGFFQYLYREYPDENKFIYLDPDTYVYSDFVELRTLLDNRPIVVCPHLLEYGNIDMELSSTAHGVYNLGFLAVNNSDEAKEFINWWSDRLSQFCYDDIPHGIFTDQKWIDLAPCFFDVEILKHHGYDFATWSLLNCDLSRDGDKILVHGDELRFIHFSGYGAVIEKCIRDWLPPNDVVFKDLYKKYCLLHEENNQDNVSKTEWTYCRFSCGEKINRSSRITYRSNTKRFENPFLKNNKSFKILKMKTQIVLKDTIKRIIEILKKEGSAGIWIRIKKRIQL